MLQYKIPQDVGIADKIVGPFSLRQLIIVAIGAGISYVLFAAASKLYELNVLEYIIIVLPAIIALAAAMVKINNIPLPKFVLLVLEFAIKPKKRIWDHRGIVSIVAPNLNDKKTEIAKTASETKTARRDVNLEDLSRVLDSGGFEHVQEIKHEEIDQAADDDLMIEAFFGHKKGSGENMWARTAKDKIAYERKLKLLSKLPKTEIKALKQVKQEIELIKKENELKSKSISPVSTAPKAKIEETAVKTALPLKKPEKPESSMLNKVTEKVDNNPPRIADQGIKSNKEDINRTSSDLSEKTIAEKQKTYQKQSGTEQVQATEAPFKKKKRRRKKKPKFAQPIRPETQIDSMQKKKPIKLTPAENQNNLSQNVKPVKNEQPTQTRPEAKKEIKGGEIHLEELQRGEIELNLD